MLATVVTQPLIVAKVGLQSKPPPARNGVPFKSFTEVMQYIIEHEGPHALFKGIGPQILKGLLVQGFLMMTKERYVYRDSLTKTPWLTFQQDRTFFHSLVQILPPDSRPKVTEACRCRRPAGRQGCASAHQIDERIADCV